MRVMSGIPPYVRTTGLANWNRYAAVNDELILIHMDDGGPMVFFTSEFRCDNQDGALVCRGEQTSIYHWWRLWNPSPKGSERDGLGGPVRPLRGRRPAGPGERAVGAPPARRVSRPG